MKRRTGLAPWAIAATLSGVAAVSPPPGHGRTFPRPDGPCAVRTPRLLHFFKSALVLLLITPLLLLGCGGGGGGRQGTVVTPVGALAENPLSVHLTVEGSLPSEITATWEQHREATRYELLRRVGVGPFASAGVFSCPQGVTLPQCFPRLTDAVLANSGAQVGSTVGYMVRAYAGDRLLAQSAERTVVLSTTWGSFFRGNVSATGHTTETINVPPVLAWSANLAGAIFAAPAVDTATRTLYVGTTTVGGAGQFWAIPLDGPVQEVNDTGDVVLTLKERWKYTSAGAFVASPALADGLVFAASRDNTLYGLDAATGALRWQFFANDDIGSSPVVAYGRVLVGAGNPTPGADSQDNTLYCLDAFPDDNGDGVLSAADVDEGLDDADGVPYDLIWKITTQGPVGASPSVRGGLVVVGASDDRLYMVDVFTGQSREVLVGSDVVATAPLLTVGNTTAAYVGTRNQISAYGLQGVGSAPLLLWQMGNLNGDVLGSPAVGENVLVFPVASQTVGANNKLYAVDATQGPAATKWVFESPDEVLLATSPLIAGNKVFFGTGNPATSNPNGKVGAVSLSTGALLWQEQVGAAVAPPVLAGGLLLVGANTGVLRAYRNP